MGYSVKQVSAMTGLPVSTLRYYDKMGLLPGLERRPSGYRSFTDGDLEMLRIIDSFRQAGLQIRGMQEYIRLVQQGAGTLEKRYEMFLDQERKLKARMAELEQALQVTRRKLRYYQEALKTGSEDSLPPAFCLQMETGSDEMTTADPAVHEAESD